MIISVFLTFHYCINMISSDCIFSKHQRNFDFSKKNTSADCLSGKLHKKLGLFIKKFGEKFFQEGFNYEVPSGENQTARPLRIVFFVCLISCRSIFQHFFYFVHKKLNPWSNRFNNCQSFEKIQFKKVLVSMIQVLFLCLKA